MNVDIDTQHYKMTIWITNLKDFSAPPSAQVPWQLGNAAKEHKAGSQHSSFLAEKKTSCKSAWQIMAGKAKGKLL